MPRCLRASYSPRWSTCATTSDCSASTTTTPAATAPASPDCTCIVVVMPHKDPDERRRYLAEWKLRNPQRKAFLNKCADAASHANQRAARYGAPGILTATDVRMVLQDGGAKCHYCGSSSRLGIDHVVPLSRRGSNDRSNLVACCHSCNASKHRGDRPGRWSRTSEQCIRCGGTDSRHAASGVCNRCWIREKKAKAIT